MKSFRSSQFLWLLFLVLLLTVSNLNEIPISEKSDSIKIKRVNISPCKIDSQNQSFTSFLAEYSLANTTEKGLILEEYISWQSEEGGGLGSR